jgi:hypothetical protein
MTTPSKPTATGESIFALLTLTAMVSVFCFVGGMIAYLWWWCMTMGWAVARTALQMLMGGAG